MACFGKTLNNKTKQANSGRKGFNKGHKNADGHSGTIRVPTERHSRARLITSITKETGGQSQLFSPRQSMEKASMALQLGDMSVQLNLGTWALQWDAKRLTGCGPHLQSNWGKPPDSRTSRPYQRNDWEDWLWDGLREESTAKQSEPIIHWASVIIIVAELS